MMLLPTDARRAIIEAILRSNPEWAVLFRTNAHFKQGLEFYVLNAGLFIDGLARYSTDAQRQIDEATERVMRGGRI